MQTERGLAAEQAQVDDNRLSAQELEALSQGNVEKAVALEGARQALSADRAEIRAIESVISQEN